MKMKTIRRMIASLLCLSMIGMNTGIEIAARENSAPVLVQGTDGNFQEESVLEERALITDEENGEADSPFQTRSSSSQTRTGNENRLDRFEDFDTEQRSGRINLAGLSFHNDQGDSLSVSSQPGHPLGSIPDTYDPHANYDYDLFSRSAGRSIRTVFHLATVENAPVFLEDSSRPGTWTSSCMSTYWYDSLQGSESMSLGNLSVEMQLTKTSFRISARLAGGQKLNAAQFPLPADFAAEFEAALNPEENGLQPDPYFDSLGLYETSDGLVYQLFSNGQANVQGGQNDTIEEVTIPSQVTWNGTMYQVKQIGHYADYNTHPEIGKFYSRFSGLPNLRKVTIEPGIESIVGCAFDGCSSLKEICFPDSIKSYSLSALNNCSSLKSVRLSNSADISRGMFAGASSLEELLIPEGVSRIDRGSFDGCTNLRKVTIPRSVTTIEGNDSQPLAFMDSPNLVIYGFSGSEAQRYATQYGIQFVDLETQSSDRYELTASLGNNKPAIVNQGETVWLNVQLKKNGEVFDEFDRSHRKSDDLEVSADPSKNLAIKDCYFHLNGTPVFVMTLEGKQPGKTTVHFRDKVTGAGSTFEIWVSEGAISSDAKTYFAPILEDSFQNVCIGFLRNDANYPASLLVSQKDPKFGAKLTGFVSNVVFRGIEGWEEQFLQTSSTKAAQEILLGFITENSSLTRSIAEANTTLDFGKKAVSALKTYTSGKMLGEMSDSGMLKAIEEKISSSEKQSAFMNMILDGDCDEIAKYFRNGTDLDAGQITDFMNKFYESSEYLDEVGRALKNLGYAGKIASATSKTFANLEKLTALKNTDDYYIECLEYLSKNCSFPQVRNAAAHLKNSLESSFSATMLTMYDALETSTNLVIDGIIDDICEKLPPSVQLYKAALDLGITLGNGLFAIDEAQEAYDKLRTAAYMNTALSAWVAEKNEAFQSVCRNGTDEDIQEKAETLMGSLGLLSAARENGETILQNYLDSYRFFGFPNPLRNNELFQLSAGVQTTLQGHIQYYDLKNKGTKYLTICVACPVDLSVLSSDGSAVLSLVNGKTANGLQERIYYSAAPNPLTGDFLKTIAIPQDEGLSLQIDAKALGAVDYSVLCTDGNGLLRLRSLNNIPVNTGDFIRADHVSFTSNLMQTTAADGQQTSLSPIERNGDQEIAVTEIQTSCESVSLKKGQSVRITPTVVPSNATAADVFWTSENESVVTVSDEGVVTAVEEGQTTVTVHALNGFSKAIPVQVTGNAEPVIRKIVMFRLYNPNSGEHFYTSSENEKNFLVSVGWKDEGEGWKAPEISSIPVYRLYNENAGDHHYTLNEKERDALIGYGWKDEGIGWYSDETKSVPLYRQYNPNAKAGSHNYTTSLNEHQFLTANGWNDEGIAWYGVLNE